MSEEKDKKVDVDLRMSDKDMKEFVLGLCDGKIFTSAQVRGDHIGMVFMPLVLGGLRHWHPDELEEIGVIWEWLDKASPMGVNGMPSFFSCRITLKDDWHRALEAYKREMERRDNIQI